MSGMKSSQGAITRRSFLKTTAAVGTVAACSGLAVGSVVLAAADEAAEQNGEQTFASFCRGNCGSSGCNLNVHVREGKVVRVNSLPFSDADPKTKGRSRICLRGMSNVYRLYSPQRIGYPMRRVEGTPRGGGEWERISWEEAIKQITDTWKGIIEADGPSAIAGWTIYGNSATLQGIFGLGYARLAALLGMSTISNGADMGQIYSGAALAASLGVGASGPNLAAHARNIVLWGANSAVTWPHEWRYMLDAQANGAKITLIDPNVSITAAKVDNHVRIRPCTDSALLMGMCNYIIQNDLVDTEFVLARTNGPCLVKQDDGLILRGSDFGKEFEVLGAMPYSWQPITTDSPYVWDTEKKEAVPADEAAAPALTGSYTVNGKKCTTAFDMLKERVADWSLERTAEVCDITPEEIVMLADCYVNGPTMSALANGPGHYSTSWDYFFGTYELTMLTGNLFRPGAGWANTGQTMTGIWSPDTSYGVPENAITGPEYSVLDLPEIQQTGTYLGKPATVKSAIIHSANPLGNSPDRKRLLEAVDAMDLLVVVDMNETDSTRYADIVLPCTHWFECDDIAGFNCNPYTFIGEKAVEPMFEHKSDYQITRLLAEGMGFGDKFKKEDLEVLEESVNKGVQPDANGNPITWERLKKEKNIRTIPDDYYDPSVIVPDGRLMMYWEHPAARLTGKEIDVVQERLPHFEPPNEAWPEDVPGYPKNSLADKYPIILMNIHARLSTHTTYNHIAWLTELRPEPFVNLNTEDAKERGIAQGDLVKVFNDRGYVIVKAQIDGGLRKGIANLPHGWEADQFIEGHYQDLTPRASNPVDDNECYFDCLCQVEKYEGGK